MGKLISNVLQSKIDYSYEVLKTAAKVSMTYYHKPLILTYSGGKDSDVMLQLAMECLQPNEFEVMNSHTTVDAPQTVYHIREKFADLEKKNIHTYIQYHHYPDGRYKSMWTLIVDRQIPPTRLARYCCEQLKESSTPNRLVATGVRSAESNGRKGRDDFQTRGKTKADAKHFDMHHIQEVVNNDADVRKELNIDANTTTAYDCIFVEKAKKNDDLITMPIYRWLDKDVWDFLRDREIKVNPLYAMGYDRVGCVGCPLGGRKSMIRGFNDFPKYKQMYIKAFDKMMEKRKATGKNDVIGKTDKHRWVTGEDVFNWWIDEDMIKGQISIEDYMNK